MSKTIINLEGSKQLMASLFEMEIGKITETIRRETKDDKDALILKLEAEIESLRNQNRSILSVIEDLRRVICKGF
jgi:hypothetical protein